MFAYLAGIVISAVGGFCTSALLFEVFLWHGEHSAWGYEWIVVLFWGGGWGWAGFNFLQAYLQSRGQSRVKSSLYAALPGSVVAGILGFLIFLLLSYLQRR